MDFDHPVQFKGFNFCCECYCIIILLLSHRIFSSLVCPCSRCFYVSEQFTRSSGFAWAYIFFFFFSFGWINGFFKAWLLQIDWSHWSLLKDSGSFLSCWCGDEGGEKFILLHQLMGLKLMFLTFCVNWCLFKTGRECIFKMCTLWK